LLCKNCDQPIYFPPMWITCQVSLSLAANWKGLLFQVWGINRSYCSMQRLITRINIDQTIKKAIQDGTKDLFQDERLL
jgi:hypothetical protein